MSYNPNRRTNKDANHDDIVDALTNMGGEVFFVEKPADLIVAFSHRFTVVEIKRDHRAKSKTSSISDYQFSNAELDYYEKVKNSAPYVVIQTRLQAVKLFEACTTLDAVDYVSWCRERVREWALEVYRDPVKLTRITGGLQPIKNRGLI